MQDKYPINSIKTLVVKSNMTYTLFVNTNYSHFNRNLQAAINFSYIDNLMTLYGKTRTDAYNACQDYTLLALDKLYTNSGIVPNTIQLSSEFVSGFYFNDSGDYLYRSYDGLLVGVVFHLIGLILIYLLLDLITLSFTSLYELKLTKILLTVKKETLNYTTNFSAYNGSGLLIPTSSLFTPYFTTIGLYDNNNLLLAIAKLCQPIKRELNMDIHFEISFTEL